MPAFNVAGLSALEILDSRGRPTLAVTVQLADGTKHVLHALDSCHIPGGEARAIRNDANTVATMLVVMPHPVPRP